MKAVIAKRNVTIKQVLWSVFHYLFTAVCGGITRVTVNQSTVTFL
jgi:hypothetical protein